MAARQAPPQVDNDGGTTAVDAGLLVDFGQPHAVETPYGPITVLVGMPLALSIPWSHESKPMRVGRPFVVPVVATLACVSEQADGGGASRWPGTVASPHCSAAMTWAWTRRAASRYADPLIMATVRRG